MRINILIVLLFLNTGLLLSQIITFPDPIFKSKLIDEGVDTNNDGEIQESEALEITNLNVNSAQSESKIINLEGIAYFTNLSILNCGSNLLSSLDVSALINLEILKAYNNQLTSINVNGLNQLIQLWVSSNQLTNIDVSTLQNLDWLFCSSNQINNLDISMLINLHALWASNNQISSLDLLPLNVLTQISLDNNNLSSLNVNHLNDLQILSIQDNLFTDIDVSNMPNLLELRIGENNLAELDGGSTGLEVITCENNPNLTTINVQNNVISTSDPDLLYFGFYFYDLPNLEFICMDPGEEQALSHSGYNPDNVIVTINPDCSLSVNDYLLNETYIYPNPVNENFYIHTNVEIKNHTLYNITGTEIIKTSNESTIKNIVSLLHSGVYFLVLETIKGQKKTIKLIKE